MALAQWPEVLAGIRWIVVAASRHAGRWLAVWPVTGTAIRINVNMETVVAGGKPAKRGVTRKLASVSESSSVPISLPMPPASIAFMVTVSLAA